MAVVIQFLSQIENSIKKLGIIRFRISLKKISVQDRLDLGKTL